MEQSPFMMWSKRRLGGSNPIYGDSWEEQAFAEDAAGALGGCIWPPRSYSCSFCRREFRSAQALGGHMNVHRRDRARLKQSPDPNHGILHQMAHPNQTGHDSISPQIHQLFYNPSPKSALGAAAAPISPSGAPCHPVDGGRIEHGKIPPYLSSFQGEFQGRLSGGVTFVPSRSNSLNENFRHIKAGSEKDNNSRSDPVQSNFLTSLNLATRTQSLSSDDDEEEEEEEEEEGEEVEEEEEVMTSTTFRKRRRMDEPSMPILLKRTLRSVVDVDELSDNTGEELDLELRLGGRPKGNLLRS